MSCPPPHPAPTRPAAPHPTSVHQCMHNAVHKEAHARMRGGGPTGKDTWRQGEPSDRTWYPLVSTPLPCNTKRRRRCGAAAARPSCDAPLAAPDRAAAARRRNRHVAMPREASPGNIGMECVLRISNFRFWPPLPGPPQLGKPQLGESQSPARGQPNPDPDSGLFLWWWMISQGREVIFIS